MKISIAETTDDEKNPTLSPPDPRVSVIIPAYRASRYISETLDSVFQQTFQDFEVIVVNDGSPDTAELEAALEPYLSRIRYVKQANRGASAARNNGIRQSRGSLIALLDSDDLWLPEYLNSQIEFLNQNPQAVVAIADVVHFGDLAGGPVVQRWLRPGIGPLVNFENMIRRKAGQLPSATVVRREKAIAAGLYDEQIRVYEDLEFSMRICFPDGAIGYTGRPLAKYRRHDASLTGKITARQILNNEVDSLRIIARKLPLKPEQRALVEREIRALEAELAMMDFYEGLAHREFKKAGDKLSEANRYFRDQRLLLALVALRVFPHWTSRILLARERARRTTNAEI